MCVYKCEHQLPTWVSFLILSRSSICSDELRESTVVANELGIGPHLTDASIVQHNNEVTLGEEAETMSDKDAGLGEGEESRRFCATD